MKIVFSNDAIRDIELLERDKQKKVIRTLEKIENGELYNFEVKSVVGPIEAYITNVDNQLKIVTLFDKSKRNEILVLGVKSKAGKQVSEVLMKAKKAFR